MYYDLCNGSLTTSDALWQACHEADMLQLAGANGSGLLGNGSLVANGNFTEDWGIQTIVKVVVPLSFGAIGLAGLLGNALVIIVVAANQQMRSTTNLLIINLAVSDILFVIFCVPFTACDYVLSTWPFGDTWCKVVQYMIVVTCHASVYTLVLMSFDRFVAVVYPVSSMSWRTERNAIFAIVSAWVVITLTAIPVALSHGILNFPYEGNLYTTCMFQVNRGYNLRWFQVSFFLTSYVVPLALISLLYMCMLTRLWRGGPGKPSAESRRGKRRVTRMIYIVVLAFAVCWLPIQVILVLKSFERFPNTSTTVILQILSHILAYSSSCVNPVLYAFLSDHFRKAFRKFMRIGQPRPQLDVRNCGGKTKGATTTNTTQQKATNTAGAGAAAAAKATEASATGANANGTGTAGTAGGAGVVGAVEVTKEGVAITMFIEGDTMSRTDIL